jgi:hypothetical protein
MHKTRNSLRSFRDKIYISHVCLSLVVILVPRPPILSILFLVFLSYWMSTCIIHILFTDPQCGKSTIPLLFFAY